MSVTGTLTVSTSFQQQATNVPGSTAPSLSNQQTIKAAFITSGSLADQVALKHSKTYIMAAAPLDLDLTMLTDVFGAAISFTKVRSITVVHRGTTDGQDVLFGYASTTSNAWVGLVTNPGQITIKPSTAANGGAFVHTAPNTTGFPVTSSSKLIQFDPGANTITIDLEIVGA